MARTNPEQGVVAELDPEAAEDPGPEGEAVGSISATAVAAEALQTGVVPLAVPSPEPEIPGAEGERLQIGDPDVSALANELSGEEAPGSSSPTPDQNQVDDIGRAYGLQEEDGSPLRSAAELLEERDRHRQD